MHTPTRLIKFMIFFNVFLLLIVGALVLQKEGLSPTERGKEGGGLWSGGAYAPPGKPGGGAFCQGEGGGAYVLHSTKRHLIIQGDY